MKILITIILLISFQGFSQKLCTAEYVFTGLGEDADLPATFKVSLRPGQMAIRFDMEGLHEYLVIDTKQKKVVELIEETYEDETLKEAYITNWEDSLAEDDLLMTFISELCISGYAEKSAYRLLPDKKKIFGKECRKIEMLDGTAVVGSGWLIPGFYLEAMSGFGFMRAEEGTIVEFTVDDGLNSYTCTLKSLEMSADPADFSFEIPEG